jgi:hypothetical protein
MTGRWNRWVQAVAQREPATPLALFRIAVGLILLHTYFLVWNTGGVVVWLDRDSGGIHHLTPKNWLIQALGGATEEAVYGLIIAGVISAFTLAIGLFGRVSAFVSLQVGLALFHLLPSAGGGHDRLLTNALWILVLAGSTATLSVDARIRTGRWRSDTPVFAWPRYVLIVQLCLVYGATGIQKLGSSWFPWGGYSAVYYALLTPSWTRYDFSTADWIAWAYPLTQLGTAVAWIWEVSFPVVLLWLWWRHTYDRGGRLRAFAQRIDLRVPYAIIGLTMHAVLFTLMELGPFSLITTSFYIAMWHHDELVKRLPWLAPVRTQDNTPTASGAA